MLKTITKFLGRQPEDRPAVNLEPHRSDVEFALLLVETGSDPQTAWTVGSVVDDAVAFKGVVLQIMGPVIFVAFTGVAGATGTSQRKEFVAHVIQKHRILVRALHGKRSALVGNIGGSSRRSYTVIPDKVTELLAQLAKLGPGEMVET